jgi:signal transduction histidine kinase
VKVATLWRINRPAGTVSAIARVGFTPSPNQNHEFVHPIEPSLIGSTIEHLTKTRRVYFDIPDVQAHEFFKFHRAQERARELRLHRLVSIPAYNANTTHPELPAAVLHLYVSDAAFHLDEDTAITIQSVVSSILSNAILSEQIDITNKMLEIYSRMSNEVEVRFLFRTILDGAIFPYIQAEACSFYLWDPFHNCYSLAHTTGLAKPTAARLVRDYPGHGLVGEAGVRKKVLNLTNIRSSEETSKQIGAKKAQDDIVQFMEQTAHSPTSVLVMPITNPSRPESEASGVIKIVNKLSPLSSNVVDYFHPNDIIILNQCARMLSSHLDQILSEQARNAFALKMGHEMQAPSVAIRGTADRFIKHFDDETQLPRAKRLAYLSDIRDYSLLQIYLARSVELGSQVEAVPRGTKYRLQIIDLASVIETAKSVVKPLCRTEGLSFDSIQLKGSYPRLAIDRFAWTQVFFNLFTNAIKYRQRENVKDAVRPFQVIVECEELGPEDFRMWYNTNKMGNPLINAIDPLHYGGYVITIEDYGVGIRPENAHRVFSLGFREPGLEALTVRGSGVGLWLSRNILRDFYCSICVAAFINPTQFEVLIPKVLVDQRYAQASEWMRAASG